MNLHLPFLSVFLASLLTACLDSDMSLNLQLDDHSGLVPGDSVVARDQVVGRVVSVDTISGGGSVAHLDLDSEFRSLVTTGARFQVVADPNKGEHKQVEILPGPANALPLGDHATVHGTVRKELLSPLTDILRDITEGLGIFRGQVEQFRSEMQRLPHSDEARRLQEQWQQLQREMKEAQSATEDALKKDVIPKLQQQMDELNRKLQELQKAPPRSPLPSGGGGKSTPVF